MTTRWMESHSATAGMVTQEEDLGECCSPLSSLAGVSVATHPCCYMLVNVAIH